MITFEVLNAWADLILGIAMGIFITILLLNLYMLFNYRFVWLNRKKNVVAGNTTLDAYLLNHNFREEPEEEPDESMEMGVYPEDM